MSSDTEIKTARLGEMLAASGFGAVLINNQHNFAWLTGGASNGIDLSRDAGAASILVCSNAKRYLLASNIEMQRMLAEQISTDDFEPIDYRWQDEKASSTFVIDKGKQLIAGEIVTDNALENKVAECRYSLTETERMRFRELARGAAEAMSRTVSSISPGETEIEIAETLRHELAASDVTSVVVLVGADERIARYRHPVPTVNRWKKELLLVTCAKRHGVIASLSRMITVGEPSDELKKKTEAAAFVHASLLNATKVGATGSELYDVARRAYVQNDFEDEIDRHHQGGATGYRTRDWVAHPMSSEIVKLHQAFAWNPSITGTKVEESCIVSDDGIEIVTAIKDQPTITTMIDGREFHSPDIISI